PTQTALTRRASEGHRTARRQRSARYGTLPGRIILDRKNFLNPLRPSAALIVQHLQRLADLCQPRVVRGTRRVRTATDAIENRRQIEQLAARLQEVCLQRLGGGDRAGDTAAAGTVGGTHDWVVPV